MIREGQNSQGRDDESNRNKERKGKACTAEEIVSCMRDQVKQGLFPITIQIIPYGNGAFRGHSYSRIENGFMWSISQGNIRQLLEANSGCEYTLSVTKSGALIQEEVLRGDILPTTAEQKRKRRELAEELRRADQGFER